MSWEKIQEVVTASALCKTKDPISKAFEVSYSQRVLVASCRVEHTANQKKLRSKGNRRRLHAGYDADKLGNKEIPSAPDRNRTYDLPMSIIRMIYH